MEKNRNTFRKRGGPQLDGGSFQHFFKCLIRLLPVNREKQNCELHGRDRPREPQLPASRKPPALGSSPGPLKDEGQEHMIGTTQTQPGQSSAANGAPVVVINESSHVRAR